MRVLLIHLLVIAVACAVLSPNPPTMCQSMSLTFAGTTCPGTNQSVLALGGADFCTVPCNASSDCPATEFCNTFGACTRACNSDAQCNVGRCAGNCVSSSGDLAAFGGEQTQPFCSFSDSSCSPCEVLLPSITCSQVGFHCNQNSDCAPEETCDTLSQECFVDNSCTTNNDCPNGQNCVSFGGQQQCRLSLVSTQNCQIGTCFGDPLSPTNSPVGCDFFGYNATTHCQECGLPVPFRFGKCIYAICIRECRMFKGCPTMDANCVKDCFQRCEECANKQEL